MNKHTGAVAVVLAIAACNSVHAQSTSGSCDYTNASENNGWGWDPTTRQSCPPIGASGTSTMSSAGCDYSRAQQNGGWGWDPVRQTSCPPVTQAPGSAGGHPVCQAAEADVDGDGYGWENSRTCVVTQQPSAAVGVELLCRSASSDPDGDGYGWEDGQSCKVAESGSDQANPFDVVELEPEQADEPPTPASESGSEQPPPLPEPQPQPVEPEPEPEPEPVEPEPEPVEPEPAAPVQEPATPEQSGRNNPPPLNLSNVQWLHTDVSNWPQSATLSSVTFDGSRICLNYNRANAWPVVNGGGTQVVGNPWVFIWNESQSRWYGATWEWLRPGQVCKAKSSVAGDHIKRSPYTAASGWRPKSGEVLYFMVSGTARGSNANVRQRTAPVRVVWP